VGDDNSGVIEATFVVANAAGEVAMRAAEGVAASDALAAVDVISNNQLRVEPTQYPQRTCSRLTNLRVSDELARFTSNLREYRNSRNHTQ
jgi:hypothetical protein